MLRGSILLRLLRWALVCSKELCPGAFEARAAGRSEADSDFVAGGGHAGRARPKKGAAATATAAGRTGFGTLQKHEVQ